MSYVLLVEADQDVGAGLAGILAADGHELRWARTAGDARRLITDRVPDPIALDLGLPDAGGLDLCAATRDRHAEVVVVVVTARTDEADAVRALDGGADDFVTKPFRPVELRARLRAHLRRRVENGPPELRAGPVRLDQRGRRAAQHGGAVSTRSREPHGTAVSIHLPPAVLVS